MVIGRSTAGKYFISVIRNSEGMSLLHCNKRWIDSIIVCSAVRIGGGESSFCLPLPADVVSSSGGIFWRMEVLAERMPDGGAAAGGMRSALQLALERVVPRHMGLCRAERIEGILIKVKARLGSVVRYWFAVIGMRCAAIGFGDRCAVHSERFAVIGVRYAMVGLR